MPPSLQEKYSSKCQQFQELNEQFQTYQDECQLIIDDIETQNKRLSMRLVSLEREHEALKSNTRQQINNLTKELEASLCRVDLIEKEKRTMRMKCIELQNVTEGLQNEVRAANAMLGEYEQRVERNLEQIAFLHSKLVCTKEDDQEKYARLACLFKESEEQINALRKKQEEHKAASNIRMSRISQSSALGNQISQNIRQSQLIASSFHIRRAISKDVDIPVLKRQNSICSGDSPQKLNRSLILERSEIKSKNSSEQDQELLLNMFFSSFNGQADRQPTQKNAPLKTIQERCLQESKTGNLRFKSMEATSKSYEFCLHPPFKRSSEMLQKLRLRLERTENIRSCLKN